MRYTAYSSDNIYMKRIVVSGILNEAGEPKGGHYAEVQIMYNDADMNELKEVFYEEFCWVGRSLERKYVGNGVEWGEDNNFKVLLDGEDVALWRSSAGSRRR